MNNVNNEIGNNHQVETNENIDEIQADHKHGHNHKHHGEHHHEHSDKNGGKKKLGRKLMNIIRQNPDFTKADILATGILTEGQIEKAISKVTEKGFLKMDGEKFIIDEIAFKQYHQDHHPEEGKGKGCKGHHDKETKFSSINEVNFKL